MNKIKLFFYGDSPTCASGFGTVTRNILEKLHNTGRFDITVLGVNYHGGWHESGLVERYHIERAGNNPKGDILGCDKLIHAVAYGDYDIYLSLQNLSTPAMSYLASAIDSIREKKKKPFKWIHYFPIDGEAYPAWNGIIERIDYPVCYLEFAKKKILEICPQVKDRLQVITHGVNTSDYYPEPEKKSDHKADILGEAYKDRFLVTNVNRFMQRKDVPRSLLIFREFKKLVPESIFYPHCSFDHDEMGNIADHARATGLNLDDIVFNDPQYFNHNQGYSIAGMRRIYNASDVIMSTSLGEGWGLSCTEAMACKIPVLFPNNTSFPEIIGSDRGFLIDSGKTIGDFVVMPEDNGMWRPLSSVEDAVEKLFYIYKNKEEAQRRAEIAFNWVQGITWDKVCDQWVDLIDKAVSEL